MFHAPALFMVEGDFLLGRAGLLLRLELTSDPGILSAVRSVVTCLSANMGFPEAESRALTRAVDEALANIIRHAYANRNGRPIELLCRRITERVAGKQTPALEIVIIDSGISGDCKKFCGRPLDEVRPGGLGMHFIQQGADVVQYSRRLRKNHLRLVKYLPVPEPQNTSAKGAK